MDAGNRPSSSDAGLQARIEIGVDQCAGQREKGPGFSCPNLGVDRPGTGARDEPPQAEQESAHPGSAGKGLAGGGDEARLL
jgi:hypothetical protein